MTGINKDALKKVLAGAFKGSWELGGGMEFRYMHGVQVAEFSTRIAEKESLEVDMDALYVAGLFHDIGKVEAINAQGEIEYGSKANKEHENIDPNYLMRFTKNLISMELAEKVVRIIGEKLSPDASIERKVLKDADELGNFGFSQVWRAFSFATLAKQTFYQMINFWKSGSLEDRKAWINQLYFETSKSVATERYERFADFLKILEMESAGADIK